MQRRRGFRFRSALIAMGLIAGLTMACGAPGGNTAQPAAANAVPARPSAPVKLNILDIAGNLQLTKQMIENFKNANPDVISGVTYSTAPAPSMAGKLKAEQDGGVAQTHLVLSGTDGLSAGIANGVLTKVLPDFTDRFPNLEQNYQEPAAAMQKLTDGFGVEVVYYPSGPLLEFNPAAVATAPTSPAELLEWAKANPEKFQYANPANSGPGRTFLMGLPYLLGDKDPKDPENGWDKTWAFLAELGKYVKYYPSGTTEVMKNLGSGAVDMVMSTTGWDINPRKLGTVPNTVKVGLMQSMTWVTDAQYALIPKGLSADQTSAILLLVQWMLKPDQQAIAYDDGYFYPGPAVKGVTLDMAPQGSQDTIKQFGRPEYEQWIAQYPKQPSLAAPQQVKAFDKWNKLVGAGKGGK
ncbi:extracellular solute-binding protein [Amycolatopsis sp.]|uniref:extracellular solute-binding protein n=1 Tax=Amycolatopsis sp. TaxID=37632 RepID=UPI002E0B4F27|nr:extracellular solute-binding protein [Amycolatopsis sp.]